MKNKPLVEGMFENTTLIWLISVHPDRLNEVQNNFSVAIFLLVLHTTVKQILKPRGRKAFETLTNNKF